MFLKEEIERENPDILSKYKSGQSRREIVEEKDLTSYGIKFETAMHIISLIVYGSIPQGERLEIAREHEQNGARKTHIYQKKNHCGIYERLDKDGLNSASRGAANSRGYSVWTEEQKKLLQALANNPRCQWQEGKHKGCPDGELMATELNKQFFFGRPVRNRASVNLKYFKLRHPERKYKK